MFAYIGLKIKLEVTYISINVCPKCIQLRATEQEDCSYVEDFIIESKFGSNVAVYAVVQVVKINIALSLDLCHCKFLKRVTGLTVCIIAPQSVYEISSHYLNQLRTYKRKSFVKKCSAPYIWKIN